MRKAELRRKYLERRKALDEAVAEEESLRIADHFMSFLGTLDPLPRTLHIFLPIERNKEVNTWRIIERIREERPELRIAVSRTDFSNRHMEHVLLEEGTALEKNEKGIPEPVDGKKIEEKEIDLVLIPLLAYDKEGHRVGYGAGFYDAFLEKCRSDVLKVGVSFFGPEERVEGVGDHDVPLDRCITPRGEGM